MARDEASPTLDSLLSETEWVRALAQSLVVDPGTADDVAQDAAVIALTKPPSSAGAVRGWFRRVVGNLASNARRGESRRGARERAVAEPESQGPADETVARWEIRRQVVEAVLALEEPYRSTVLLRFFDGLTAAQAADRQSVPLETVRTRTRRGLELLRGRLAHLDDRKGKRGLAVVLVLAHLEPDLVGTGAGVGTGAATGGAVMAAATKWAGGLALLAVLGGAMTWAVVTTTREPSRADGIENATLRTAVPVKPRRAPPAADPTAPTPPDGVDLDSCDRARDLFGVVVGPDGRPVSGARVQALRVRPFGQLVAARGLVDPYAPAEETKSGFDGTFALRLAPRDSVTLRVDADGFALWESAWRQAGERLRVTLSTAMTLTVSVKSHAGIAVPDAEVRLGADGEPPAVATIARQHAATDGAGLVRFPGVVRGAKLFLFVGPPRNPNATQSITTLDADEQTVEFVLSEGHRLDVSVVDKATGLAIPGAEVRCNGAAAAGTTGTDGRFSFEDASRGSGTRIEASATGYARASVRLRDNDSEARLALVRASRLTGRVLDPDGRPVTGADVVAVADVASSNDGIRSEAGATSDVNGRFVLDGLFPATQHVIRARAPGFAMTVIRNITAAEDPWTVDVGDVRLVASRTILGSVVDGEGKPVVRMQVVLTSADAARTDLMRDHRCTDDIGRFAFSDLPPGGFRLTAQIDPNFASPDSVDVTVPADRDPPPVTIHLGGDPEKLKTRIPVRARVVDEDGNPVSGVSVQFGYVANGATNSQTTGADGTIACAAEYEPSHVFVHLTPEQARTLLAPTSSSLRPGQRDATVVLRRGRTISGKVVDEEGKPVIGGWVEAWAGSTRLRGGATNENGEFAFAVPAGARVDLAAHPKSEPRVLSRATGELLGVEPGADGLVIRVVREPAERAIDVEVVDDAGAPVVQAMVRAEFAGEDWDKPSMAWTGADGKCRLSTLPRAPVVVSATISDRAAGHNRYWSPMAIRLNADTDEVKIILPKPRVLRGRVVGEDGAPIAGAIVNASPGTALQGCMNVAGPDGRFQILVPPDAPLPYVVRANPFPLDRKKPLTGSDLVEGDDRELEVVVHPVPSR